MKSAALVRYAEYRRFDEERVKINDAVMGLLAGSQLASHFLRLTEGSTLHLGEIFPNVDHISRFNVRSDLAREVLDSAEDHLSNMALPYVLSLHEDYMKHCVELVVEANLMTRSRANGLGVATIHGGFEDAVGATFTPGLLPLIDLLRLMRNCRIHHGGRCHKPLADASGVARARSDAAVLWAEITKAPLIAFSPGDRVRLGQRETTAAFAVTKRLTDEANVMLSTAYPRASWARLLVGDMLDTFGSLGVRMNAMQVERKIRGFARTHYAALALTDLELATAFGEAGISYIGGRGAP